MINRFIMNQKKLKNFETLFIYGNEFSNYL